METTVSIAALSAVVRGHEDSNYHMAMFPREIDPNFPKGRLFGRVTCTQTGLPLCGAAIKLQAVHPEGDIAFGIQKLGVTDENGNFDFPAVLASTYYIFATLPGYASSVSPLSRSSGFGIPCHIDTRLQDIDAVLDRVTVTPATPSEIHLSLLAGGTISGKVFWLDGSPAIHTHLTVVHVYRDESRRHYALTPPEDDHCLEELVYGSSTDDDGNFHLDGLFPGKYIVGARAPKLLNYVRKNLMWNGVPPTINCAGFYLWTGGTPNLAEAAPIEVEAGVEIPKIDLTLPMLRPNP
jgi:hypothetical protein